MVHIIMPSTQMMDSSLYLYSTGTYYGHATLHYMCYQVHPHEIVHMYMYKILHATCTVLAVRYCLHVHACM